MQSAFTQTSVTAQEGFTLTELIVTVAIAAILLSLAAPNLQTTLIKNRMASVGSQFSSHILRARNEAVTRNTCTIMCLSTNTSAAIVTDVAGLVTAGPQCANTGTDWQVGWIAFMKEDCASNTSLANSRPPRPEDYIVIREPLDADYNFQAKSPVTRIVFNASGQSGLATVAEFDMFYKTANSDMTQGYGFNMCLDVIGRTRSINWNQSC